MTEEVGDIQNWVETYRDKRVLPYKAFEYGGGQEETVEDRLWKLDLLLAQRREMKALVENITPIDSVGLKARENEWCGYGYDRQTLWDGLRCFENIVEYLKNVIANPNIIVGDYTIYNDFVREPKDFEKNNVLYQYPVNKDKLIIGKFCSIACGAKFIFNSANHTLSSLSTYPFPIFFEEWGLDVKNITKAWDNKGNIVIGNDVWIGYEAVILSGVTIGDGAIIGTRAVVTKNVPPYTIVGGVPAQTIRKRFSQDTIDTLLKIKWWDWSKERITQHISEIQSGNMEHLI